MSEFEDALAHGLPRFPEPSEMFHAEVRRKNGLWEVYYPAFDKVVQALPSRKKAQKCVDSLNTIAAEKLAGPDGDRLGRQWDDLEATRNRFNKQQWQG